MNGSEKSKARYGGRRYYAIFGIILILAVLLISGVFFWLYNASRQGLVNMWKVNAVQMARDVEYYLTRPMDAVVFASSHVEEMMEDGASNEEIGEYLVDETSVYSAIVDSNNTFHVKSGKSIP